MEYEITPDEYGKLPAHKQGNYIQDEPFENYKLKPFEPNNISMIWCIANKLSYSEFKIWALEHNITNDNNLS